MKDDTLCKVFLAGLITYELVTGSAGFGSGRGWWYAREERPFVYWLIVTMHSVALAGLIINDLLTHGHP